MLIDTNIFLSALLNQNDYSGSLKFLEKIQILNKQAYILDFALYSITIQLNHREKQDLLAPFIHSIQNFFTLYRPSLDEIDEANTLKLSLDFDDKLHYVIAKKKNLSLVSYDQDFDKTDLKRFTPAQAMVLYLNSKK